MPRSTSSDHLSGRTARAIVEQAVGTAGREREILAAALEDLDRLGWQGEAARNRWMETLAALGRERLGARKNLDDVGAALGLPGGAGDRLLLYLRLHAGKPVGGGELAGVSGIDSWTRRIRELRVEQGWPVHPVDEFSYQLDVDRPDTAGAEQWAVANRIRNLRGANGRTLSAIARLKAYFLENVGTVVTKDQLAYVTGKVQEHPRRIRELVEQGWQIDSAMDRSGLGPGDYYMVSAEQLPPKARQHIKQRNRLLKEAGYRCTSCGAAPADDVSVRLQVHHILAVTRGGDNDDDNLTVLCADCHAGKHATDRDTVADELRDPNAESRYAR